MLADMGGYLGLLLGQSIFGMYQLIASWLKWSKVSKFLKNQNKLTKMVNNDANAIIQSSVKQPNESVIQIAEISAKRNPMPW